MKGRSDGVISIGEFSKICGVSTKTLRYYSEIGSIHPEEINEENGYRYYSIKQLKKMLFINRLKSYQLSLEEIKTLVMMEEHEQEEKLYGVLRQKKRELQERMKAYDFTVKQINHDLLHIKKGVSIMSYLDDIPIKLVETKQQTILTRRQLLTGEDYKEGYHHFFQTLYEKIAKEQYTLLGKPMTIYHSAEYDPLGNDTEFAIPIKESVNGTRDFPGGLCAKSVLKGAYNELSAIYANLLEWVKKEGYELVDSPYEIYITDPNQEQHTEDWLTEVYFPIKKK